MATGVVTLYAILVISLQVLSWLWFGLLFTPLLLVVIFVATTTLGPSHWGDNVVDTGMSPFDAEMDVRTRHGMEITSATMEGRTPFDKNAKY